ncbi:MAG: NAD-dependent epimerase/dehydratase family protein [Promethearchaeota archaeon]
MLVNGGTGHLGAALVHQLVASGVRPSDVRVTYLPGTSTEALRDLPGVELFPANVLDRERLAAAFEGVRWAFHVVGNTSFDPFKKRAQWLVNVEGTRNACEAAARAGVEKLVYTSTVNVLGAPDPPGSLGDENTSPYHSKPKLHSFDSPDEALQFADDVAAGRAPRKWWKEVGIGYFDSKLAAQELVERFFREEGLPVLSVLPGTNFGPYDQFIGNGTYVLRIYQNAMPGYTAGGGLPLTHVCDQAVGHLLAMTRGRPGERYVVSGREEDNLYLGEAFQVIAEVLREAFPGRKVKTPKRKIPRRVAWFGALAYELFSKLTGKPCLLSRDAVRAGSYPSFYSCAKATRELGYAPKRSFREAVRDAVAYYSAHGLLEAKGRAIDALGERQLLGESPPPPER